MLKWMRKKAFDRHLNLNRSLFLKIFRKNKKSYYSEEEIARYTFAELRIVHEHRALALPLLARDVLIYVASRSLDEDFSAAMTPKMCLFRLVLIELVDLMASYQMDKREVVRDILRTLFMFSRCIDREVILFEEAKKPYTEVNMAKVRPKTQYILEQTAGWRVPFHKSPWNTAVINTTPVYYLELAYPRVVGGYSTLLAEALYRLQDDWFILTLLRCGVTPNPFYLWPVAIQADMKQTLYSDPDLPLPDTCIEMQCVRYFCRVRRGFRRVLFEQQVMLAADRLEVEDMFLMPTKTAYLIPEQWCSSPCPLQHWCRLVIRKQLCEADQLPAAIYQLPLPAGLCAYLDCQL